MSNKNYIVAKMSMYADVKEERFPVLERIEHHIEEFMFCDDYPEIRSVFGVTVEKAEERTEREDGIVKASVSLYMEIKEEDLDAIKRAEHHIEEFFDLEEYPEIKSVYSVKVEKEEEDEKRD